MSEVQAPENKTLDPRWIALRVSRINLGITLVGALLAFPLLWLLSGMPPWVRILLLLAFTFAMAWDLWLILLKGRESVGSFYLFDLEQAAPRTAEGAQIAKSNAEARTPRLGIRIRFANTAKQVSSAEREGTVLPRAFVSPWFTALKYSLPGDPAWRRFWPRVIPLWADSLDIGDFRRIRVLLKWK